MRRVVIASRNPDKVAEVREVLDSLGLGIEVVDGIDLPEVDETEPTLAGNALLKARAVAASTSMIALADDTGLEVDALDGEPGVRTARYAGEAATYADNVEKLLSELGDRDDRAATFRTAVALVTPDGEEILVEGVLEGRISRSPRGDNGFGYDPVFDVDGRTLAEIGTDEKNQISHRARALQALAAALATR